MQKKIRIVSTDIEPWMIYILGQFASANRLETEYFLCTYRDCIVDQAEDDHLIEYSEKKQYKSSLFIPRKERFRSNDFYWLNKDLPVFSDTITTVDGNIECDLLYNAFVHLSRLEEWMSGQRGKSIRSYAIRHPRKNRRLWKIPLVNLLFNELEQKIRKSHPDVEFGKREKPVIEFSHDVDYLWKSKQLIFKQSVLNVLKIFKLLSGSHPEKTSQEFQKAIRFITQKSTYWCFDEWAALETPFALSVVYYIYAKVRQKRKQTLMQWLIDPQYNIKTHVRLQQQCAELISSGGGIGLHGSVLSATDEALFAQEKQLLENSLDRVITKTRQHWLCYCESKTPYIHDSSQIWEDSTLGFNDISGFRSGIASRYNPYDHLAQKPFSFTEIPFVIMDSHLYDSHTGSAGLNFEWFLQSMRNIKLFEISVGWHQRVIHPDYGWEASYVQLIRDYQNRLSHESL
ncbi:MAG: hypothetical protein C4522_22185 [Desulfobacteraceae bacterium]|nr:MAG: hypothetical protein C4522_22185 [Desulfobacteraceae bacterium]